MTQKIRFSSSTTLWQRVKDKCVQAFIAEPSQDSTRMMEALIPTGSLYGIEMGSFSMERTDPAWYRTK